MRLMPVLLLIATATEAVGADVPRLIDDASHCPQWAKPETEVIDMVADGAMVLTDQSMDTIEYYCEFDRPIEFDWSDSTQIRAGYCEEPGPYIMPSVFVLRMYASERDKVYVYQQGSDEAQVFFRCDAAGH